jgi:glutamine synthetase adenylyltransferase
VQQEPWEVWTNRVEQAIVSTWGNRLAGVSILGLGSFGGRQMAPNSDIDLVFLCDDTTDYDAAHDSVRSWVGEWAEERQKQGHSVGIDFRLRPDGGKGELVRSVAAFRKYAEHEMGPWEWLMLGFSRTIVGNWRPAELEPPKVDEPFLDEIVNMRRRIEQHRGNDRDIKLCKNGLLDIEWATRVSELRAGVSSDQTFDARIEDPKLRAAYHLLRTLRARLHLLGLKDELPLHVPKTIIDVLLPAGSELDFEHKLKELRHNIGERLAWEY